MLASIQCASGENQSQKAGYFAVFMNWKKKPKTQFYSYKD